jgi:DNA repair exonuclease SbcCD ATPase subunit
VKEDLGERIAESAKLAAEIESLRQEVASRDTLLDQIPESFDQSRTRIAELTESRDRLLEEKTEVLRQLDKVQQGLNAKGSALAEVSQRLQEAEAVATMEIQSEVTSEEMKQMTESLRLLEEELSKAKTESAAQSQQLRDAAAKLAEESQAHQALMQQYRELNGKLEGTDNVFDAQAEAMEALSDEKLDLTHKLTEIESRLEGEEQSKKLITQYWSALSMELQQAIPDTMKLAMALEGLKQKLEPPRDAVGT